MLALANNKILGKKKPIEIDGFKTKTKTYLKKEQSNESYVF